MKSIGNWLDELEKKINKISNRRKRILIRSILIFCFGMILVNVSSALIAGIVLLLTSLQTRKIFYGILFLCLVFVCLVAGIVLDDND